MDIRAKYHHPNAFTVALLLTFATSNPPASGADGRRPSLVLENPQARLVIDLAGGSVGEFRLSESQLNPLSWSTPRAGDMSAQPFGHFLCLDRWGPPSEAEAAKGMPYHGEAAHVQWTLLGEPATSDAAVQAQMSATLPIAGLTVQRTIRLSANQPVFIVHEEVVNNNSLGRIFNMVQHPTIAPPFLDETTVVDCNGRRGFAQGGNLPTPEEPSVFWPQAVDAAGELVNMRHLTANPAPNVVSYALEASYGWITAATPRHGLLIGYVWKRKDYPWVSLWRDVRDGQPAARALEFGTTGLHQPFPILVQKGRIWDRPLFEYLDAGERRVKSYTGFLLRIPSDFTGVGSLEVGQGRLILRERSVAKPREFVIPAEGLIPN